MDELDDWRRVRLSLGLLDFSSMVSLAGLWVFIFGLPAAPVFVGLGLLRFAAARVLSRRESAVLESWHREGATLDDQQLLSLDAKVGRLPWRVSAGTMSSWLVMYAACVLCLEFGAAPGVHANASEHIMAGLLLLAAVSGSATTFEGRARSALFELRSAIGTKLQHRGLVDQREATSLIPGIALNTTAIILATFLGVCAVGGAVATQAWRAETLAEQQVRVLEFAAAEPAPRADFELPEGLTLLAAPPPALAALTDPGSTPALLDTRQGIAIAGVELEDGRWLVAQAELDTRVWQVLAFALIGPLFFLVQTWNNSRERLVPIARQLSEVRAATQRVLASGELRDIPRFHPPDHDEVGLLVHDFNGLLNVLEELALAAHRVTDGDLRVTFDHQGDLQAAFGGMLARLRDAVAQIQSTAIDLGSAASQIEAAAAEHEQVVETQSRGAQRTTQTVDALTNAANHIATNTSTVLASAGETLAMAESGVSQMAELRELTGAIGEMLLAVREIADRSDLLALNGSLEAVRAGEAGRGFALVAAEMRRLAERVSSLVEDIGARLGDVAQVGDATVRATEGSRDLAKRTTATAREISTLTTDQGVRMQEVATAMQQLSTSLVSTAAATAQTRASARGLLARARELEELSRDFVLS